MIYRKALETDLQAVSDIYEQIHDCEARGECTTGWIRGCYPTMETAAQALHDDELYICEDDGKVIASARINFLQEEEYALVAWEHDAPADKVCVLHTLTVSPFAAGKRVGAGFVEFYEQYAREHNRPYLRMDTNVHNLKARRLYGRLGYREAGDVLCTFHSIGNVRLLCLEKYIGE